HGRARGNRERHAARRGPIVRRQTRRDRQSARGKNDHGTPFANVHQKPPSTPMLGIETGPISRPKMTSLCKVTLSISATKDNQAVRDSIQRFSSRTSIL